MSEGEANLRAQAWEHTEHRSILNVLTRAVATVTPSSNRSNTHGSRYEFPWMCSFVPRPIPALNSIMSLNSSIDQRPRRPATTLIVVAITAIPNTYDNKAWRRAVVRIRLDERSVSET